MLKTALISRLVFLQLSGLIIEVLPIRIEDRVDVVGKGLLTYRYGSTGCEVFKRGILVRFLPKNQLTQKKLLNFEFWID